MVISRLLPFAACLPSLAAQAPTFTVFGNPCVVDPPPLAALTLPRIGQVFRLQARSGGSAGLAYEGGIAAAVVAGTSNTSWFGIPLPWTPATIQALGAGSCGDLSVAAEAMTPLPFLLPRAAVTIDMPLPNEPSLVGLSVFFQAVDYRINRRGVLGITMGTAGEARIGS